MWMQPAAPKMSVWTFPAVAEEESAELHRAVVGVDLDPLLRPLLIRLPRSRLRPPRPRPRPVHLRPLSAPCAAMEIPAARRMVSVRLRATPETARVSNSQLRKRQPRVRKGRSSALNHNLDYTFRSTSLRRTVVNISRINASTDLGFICCVCFAGGTK